MTDQDAADRVTHWLRTRPGGDRTTGPAALRVRPEYSKHTGEGWQVTVNAVNFLDGTDPDQGLFPSPVLFVPDDGGEIVVDRAAMAVAAGDPAEPRRLPDVDPEFDRTGFPRLSVPDAAIRGWREQFGDGYRVNPGYRPGPVWSGHRHPATLADRLIGYHRAGWLDRATLARELLGCELICGLTDGQPVLAAIGDDFPGLRGIHLFTTSRHVPHQRSTRLHATARTFLAQHPEHGLVVRPEHGDSVRFTRAELPAIDLAEAGVVTPEETPAPERAPAVVGTLTRIAAESGLTRAALTTRLEKDAEQARWHGFELTVDECVRHLRALAWAERDVDPPADLAANGLIRYFDEDGEALVVPDTFGKYFEDGHAGRFRWSAIVGAYVGFAIGDAVATGSPELGGLTRQLLFSTEAVVRWLPPENRTDVLPVVLPFGGRPDGWLAKAAAHAGPAPVDLASLLVTALPAVLSTAFVPDQQRVKYVGRVTRLQTGTGAGAELGAAVGLLADLFDRHLDAGLAMPDLLADVAENQRPGHDLAAEVLALRDQRDADDLTQLRALGTGDGPRSVLARALFAVAKRGDDVETALALAAGAGPVAAALAGAFLVRDGLPGLPAALVGALPGRGLVENVAGDAFYHFSVAGPQINEPRRWARRYPGPWCDGMTVPVPASAPKPAPKPSWTADPEVRSRLRGSLLAGAIGDALGAKTEFDSIERIREIAGPAGITDFIPAYGGEGRITDDTQMTLFTLEAMIRAHAQGRRQGGVDVGRSLQLAYQRWLHTQGVKWTAARGPRVDLAEPDGWLSTHAELYSQRAPGLTCYDALAGFGRGAARGTQKRPLNNSKGCGGVMRAAPIALWAEDVAEVFAVGAESAALTHGHPSGYLSSGAFAVIVHRLLRGDRLPDAVAAARTQLVRHRGHEEQSEAFDTAFELAARGGPPTPEKLASLGAGNVGETALSMSVYVALTTADADSALLAAVNHSGDSDSTGSVCGNLVGAMYGEEKLRQSWLDRLELRDVILRLADDALAEFGPDAPSDDRWFERYPVD